MSGKKGDPVNLSNHEDLKEELVEAWLDANPEFVESYFSRKAQRTLMGSFLRHSRGSLNSARARRSNTPPVGSIDFYRGSSSGASTPVRKNSGTDFDSPGILKPIVDGTHSFLGLERQLSRPVRQRKSKEELQKLRIVDEHAFLIELVKEISNDLEVKSLCHKILQNVSIMTGGDRCSLFIVNGSKDGPRFLVSQVFDVNADSRVEDLNDLEEIRVPWGTGIIGYSAETGECVNIADAYQVIDYVPLPNIYIYFQVYTSFQTLSFYSLMIAPFLSYNKGEHIKLWGHSASKVLFPLRKRGNF